MKTHDPVCWHCREPLLVGAVHYANIAGQSRAMCCGGCRAAAEWIEQLGLGDYYRLRSVPALKPSDPLAGALGGREQVWQRPEVARHVVRKTGEASETMLLIEGVRCSACVWLIERALGSLPGVLSVRVNAAARRARITWHDARISLPQILEQFHRTGYRALPLEAKALDDLRQRESRDALKRLAVAGFGAMQAMMFATVLYLGSGSIDASVSGLFRWLGFFVAIPVVFYAARPFFAGALRCLQARRLGMDVPVALAICLIFVASLFEALRSVGEVYFDSVSMFVFFLLAGRYLEMRARHRAGHLTDALARITPPFADRRRADGSLERVGIHELQAGDFVHILEGGIMPADGALLSERCRVDEAIVTGESEAVAKKKGDSLIAGSILMEGVAEIRVERTGAETTVARIAAMVERAQTQRPRLALAGEQIAGRFVARVLALTALTIAAWSFFDPSRAFSAGLAVMVVSCPCAFALAVPVAITRVLSVLARRGVLAVNPDAIQALADATHVVFDKTGTLTEPRSALTGVDTFNGTSRHEALRMAASLARLSHHPAARAITAAYANDEFDTVIDIQSHTGLGMSGCVADRRVRLGRADFALAGRDANGSIQPGAIVLADESGPLAAFVLKERLRPDASVAVDALRRQGLSILIASGDASAKVADVAVRLGIADWRAQQLPSDKLACLAQLRAQGARVIAVGDGVNDAPVLAGADVAVALGSGTDLAQTTSDIVLAGDRLESLASARSLARQALSIIRQNQRWAFFYNLSAVPLAALGFVPPWLAALGMSLSSVCVILNALRIGRNENTRATPTATATAIEDRVGIA